MRPSHNPLRRKTAKPQKTHEYFIKREICKGHKAKPKRADKRFERFKRKVAELHKAGFLNRGS